MADEILFDADGYLGAAASRFEDEHLRRRAALFGCIKSLNRAAIQLISGRSIPTSDYRGLQIAAQFARIIELFDCLVLLAQRGAWAPTRAMLRILIEAVHPMICCALSEEYFIDFLNQDEIQRLKLARTVKERGLSADTKHTEEDLDKVIQGIEAKGLKKVSAYEWARRCDRLDEYDLAYRHLSGSIHTTARDLEKHFVVESGEIAGFRLGPTDEEIDFFVNHAAMCLLGAMKAMSENFKLNKEAEIESFSRLFLLLRELAASEEHESA
ncbi:MAG: hypothetical protein H6807_11295 [Planctomycetes bacterium]|nr:hypothetical protein [Planctomycetota bacterium]